MWGSDNGDACVGLWVWGNICTVKQGVSNDCVHVRLFEMGFREDHEVYFECFHVVNNGVHFA